MSEIIVLAKGEKINLTSSSVQPKDAPQSFYFGCGWNPKPGISWDLDLCVALTSGGKLVDFVFYGKKATGGVQLSEDNRTGEGDGDDEFVKIDTSKLDPSIDGIHIGVGVYTGTDFSQVEKPHIRGCDGIDATAPQIFTFEVTEMAGRGDTVLHAADVKKVGNSWMLTTKGEFKRSGNGIDAINGFKNLFAA